MAMTQIHPITGSIIGSSNAQRVQADEKTAQLRRIEQLRKNTGGGDTFESQINSPDEVDPASDHNQKRQPRDKNPRQSKPKPPADAPEVKLDITA